MSEQDMKEGKIVIASAGVLLYRRCRGEIEVLAATRQGEPWSGHVAVVFGGLVDKDDESPKAAAFREGREETGGTLKFKIRRLVGIYGPKNYFHTLSRENENLIATKTEIPISNKYFVVFIYAGEVLEGEPTENREMLNFRFISPLELADEGNPFAFEEALVLADFWHKVHHDPSWRNPEMDKWICTPPV